jgi:branched-chain amino acid transport system ATP-binding protein
MSILQTNKLTIRFGGLTAVNEVDFTLESGHIVGIIGPNGAGKTTFINLIAGLYNPTSGSVFLDGEDITAMKPHKRARIGIGRTFQLIHPLENLSLVENVMNGFLFAQDFSVPKARKAAVLLCEELGLSRLERPTSQMNILEIKKMELAKALAVNPKILFLDEMMAGLNSDESLEVISLVQKVTRSKNLAVGVVEHVMGVIKQLTHSVVVLDGGMVIAQGKYEDVVKNERVQSAYLGGGA